MKLEELMKPSSTLPEDFDGYFYFTNDSDDEFIGKWGSKEYHFAPRTTSAIIIPTETPLNIQQIRKKFARDWAEREYGRSQAFQKLKELEHNPDGTPRLNSFHTANQYSETDLIEYIQRCLKPLPKSRISITDAENVPIESKLSVDESGALNSAAIDDKGSDLKDLATGELKEKLRKKALK